MPEARGFSFIEDTMDEEIRIMVQQQRELLIDIARRWRLFISTGPMFWCIIQAPRQIVVKVIDFSRN